MPEPIKGAGAFLIPHVVQVAVVGAACAAATELMQSQIATVNNLMFASHHEGMK